MQFQYTDENVFETECQFGTMTISGDESKGFRPYELMVSSIAVCSGNVFRKVLEKQRMTVRDIKVDADIKRDPEEANRITHIHLHYTLHGAGFVDKKVEKAMHLAQKNCPMSQSVKDSIALSESYTIAENQE
ncbi:OsmC family protein [Texcoconibacillus texcoconensis]|uniref:Putative OsmC-like protein n=1 Tax=Texcoconibacillus texcoconensis TaxID=1095777 RepID=A0A840QTS2_9BACI|nr:OsmC family protein [Texcoconibacillus texcoconensis]MBB5174667.1 putative OsmC-like protein [Texcoconibacillus texcoconensis]